MDGAYSVRVLLVESNEDLRFAYARYLAKAGFVVDDVGDLPDAEHAIAATDYDAAVFGYLFASGDGLSYVRNQRAAGWQVPVLLLSVVDRVDDGAVPASALQTVQDQLVYPVSPAEVVVRVRKLIDRPTRPAAGTLLRVGNLEIDPERHEVRHDGKQVKLTRREFAALELLAVNEGVPVSEPDLLGYVWPDSTTPAPPAVDLLILGLRRKLDSSITVQRVWGDGGYQLTVLPAASVAELDLPVTIYLSDATGHELVQAAVEELLSTAGVAIVDRDDPVLGSWFRRMRARARAAASSDLARSAATSAAHALDSRLVLAQDATVTATMMQNLGPVLGALQPTKDAVIRVGALLIVKVEWTVAVHQLTAAQQLILDHQPHLLTSPHHILDALNVHLDMRDSPTSTALQQAESGVDGPGEVRKG